MAERSGVPTLFSNPAPISTQELVVMNIGQQPLPVALLLQQLQGSSRGTRNILTSIVDSERNRLWIVILKTYLHRWRCEMSFKVARLLSADLLRWSPNLLHLAHKHLSYTVAHCYMFTDHDKKAFSETTFSVCKLTKRHHASKR